MGGAANHDQRSVTRTFADVSGGPSFDRIPDRWRMVRALGSGGQGTVWLAEDRKLGEEVAIKVLDRVDEVAVERLRREVALGRRMAHPCLVRVYDLVEVDDRLAMVMEYVDGESLAARLRRGPLPVDEAILIIRSLLEALAHLHGHDIVHRDVKPANVILARDGAVKLADLGLLRPLATPNGLTRAGAVVGTPAYLCPEQVRGETLGPPGDLYALGVTAFEAIAGRRPFAGASDVELAHRHAVERPPTLRRIRPGCPRWLARFVGRLLAKRADDRWPDAGAALHAFAASRSGLRPSLRRRAAAALVLAVVGAVTAAAWRLTAADRALAGVRVSGTTLFAETAGGRELWRRELDLHVLRATVANVLPGPAPEVVSAESRREHGLVRSELVIRAADGTELRRESVPSSETAGLFPDFPASFVACFVRCADVDADGLDEVVWAANNEPYYPAEVGIWDPSAGRPPTVMLANSGQVQDIAVRDLEGDGVPEIVTVAINNLLGYQAVLAVIHLEGRGAWTPSHFTESPDRLRDQGSAIQSNDNLSYTVLGEAAWPVSLVRTGSDGIAVRVGERTVALDRNGSPLTTAAPGRRPERRRRFWYDRMVAGASLQRADASEKIATSVLAARYPDIWAETPTRDAALLLLARDRASAGLPAAAAGLLDRAVHGGTTLRRVWREQGELLLIAGRSEEGRRLLDVALGSAGQGFPPRDEVVMLCLNAAVQGAGARFRDDLGRSVDILRDPLLTRQIAVLGSFMSGRWTETVNGTIGFGGYWPATVLALWQRLEAGAPPAEVLADTAPIEGHAEAAPLLRLLRARASRLAGDPAAAAATARTVLLELRARAGVSYESAVWYGLGEWVLGDALAAGGDTAAAGPHLEAAVSRCPGTWFAADARRRLHASS